MNKATVFYRLPNTNQIVKRSGLIENDLKPISFENNISQEVFYIAPFNEANRAFHCVLNKEIEKFEVISYSKNNKNQYDLETQFIAKTQKAIDLMSTSNSLTKVVLARCFKQNINYEININVYFLNLCLSYPNAFVYAISSSVTGTWVAASPELLLKVNENNIETTALAGTLHINADLNWTQKERDEQHKVEIYIEELAKKHQLEIKNKTGPETINAGNIKHIITNYTLEKQKNKTNLFLTELNPTPALAGLPKLAALDFIKENENLNRGFYSGLVGIKQKNTTSLFVNIRCMEIFKNHIHAYAGCGITKLSNPNKEWQETENKLQTLLKHLT